MTTQTPEMGLTLPDIATNSTLGTLPQDWALIINANFTITDGHDHSEIGTPIPSTAISVRSDVDLNEVNMLTLSSFTFNAGGNLGVLYPLALYTDGTDLWYNDALGNQTQITIGGAVNGTSSVGGFFGDYISSGAVASYDGPSNTYSFYGAGPTNPDTSTLDISILNFTGTTGLTNVILTFPSNFNRIGDSLTLVATSGLQTRSVVVFKETLDGYQFYQVIGDGNTYQLGPGYIPFTDPNGIYHLNFDDTVPITNIQPNMNWNNITSDGNTLTEMLGGTAVQSVSQLAYDPMETKEFTAAVYIPQLVNTPYWNGSFSLNLAKVAHDFISTFVNGVGVLPLYKQLLIAVQSVTAKADVDDVPYLSVAFTVTNNSNLPATLPNGAKMIVFVRIAAIFPRFNAGGEFFGNLY